VQLSDLRSSVLLHDVDMQVAAAVDPTSFVTPTVSQSPANLIPSHLTSLLVSSDNNTEDSMLVIRVCLCVCVCVCACGPNLTASLTPAHWPMFLVFVFICYTIDQ